MAYNLDILYKIKGIVNEAYREREMRKMSSFGKPAEILIES